MNIDDTVTLAVYTAPNACPECEAHLPLPGVRRIGVVRLSPGTQTALCADEPIWAPSKEPFDETTHIVIGVMPTQYFPGETVYASASAGLRSPGGTVFRRQRVIVASQFLRTRLSRHIPLHVAVQPLRQFETDYLKALVFHLPELRKVAD